MVASLITASEAADEPLCLWRHEVDRGRVVTLSLTDGALAYPVDTTVPDATALVVDDDALYVGRRDGTVLGLDLAMAMSG